MRANGRDERWNLFVKTLAIGALLVGLVGLSIVSFFQTKSAFNPMNDASIIVGGIKIGNAIAFLMACVFQYGQNGALELKKHYGTDKVLFEIPFIGFSFKNKYIYDLAWGVCASIDAGTNIIWLNQNTSTPSQPFYIKLITYPAMVALVFVEEVVGQVTDALIGCVNELKTYGKPKVNTGNNNRPAYVPPSKPTYPSSLPRNSAMVAGSDDDLKHFLNGKMTGKLGD